MALSVKIESFEGPLDLLLHLIDVNKFNIFDIPIVEITAQYMEYVQAMETQDLNIMSEFLVMAATLLEYKMYKYMSFGLRDRLSMSGKTMYKSPTIPEEVAEYETPVNLEELVGDLTLKQLDRIFQSIMKRQTDKIDPIRSKFGRIEQEEVSLDEKMVSVRAYAAENPRFRFSALMEGQKSRIQMIVTFLAILELMKTGELSVIQEHPFDDMLIVAQL